MPTQRDQTQRRRLRVRNAIRKNSDRLRLSIFRSGRHIYAQVIDDRAGRTLAAASSVEKDLRSSHKSGADIFDRGAYRYHGRVKALADAARDAGLQF